MGNRRHVMDVCREFAGAVAPAFAGAVVVDVVENIVRGEEPPAAPIHQNLLLRRVAVGGTAPHHPAGEVHTPPEGTPRAQVLADLQPRLVNTGAKDDAAQAATVGRPEARSLIVAPLVLHGRALGVVTLYRLQQEDPFDESDLALAHEMCAHTALRIDHARLYMREWMNAATVQHKLLPQPPAVHHTVETAPVHLLGSEGGGAWFDAIALPGARTALVVGNVEGQGIAAAMTVGLLRTALHTLIAMDLEPDELLARLSDATAQLARARAALPTLDPLNRDPFTTGCVIAILDPVDHTCSIARAGLPEPVAVLPDGTSAMLRTPAGPSLGTPDDAPFPATTLPLPAGSTLAMGTLAFTEPVLAPCGPLRPLLDCTSSTPLTDVRDALAATLSGQHRDAEALLLLARTKALPPAQILTHSLPADPRAAPIARAATRDQLKAWGLDEETAFTAELIVSEFVGNAIRYGAPPLRLRLVLGHTLTCEVSDAAPSAPHVRHARTVDENGRGLFIIASLAERWGTRFQSLGKTVWAEQPLKASTPALKPSAVAAP
ncbi:SpoIIE family protein phosphatase [Streptomyces sp. NPDC096934]|uniref:ATP-binding SpoIIE family protein phosphatase n=1 Tax=Streptomyces sp. NPDC096934 TaxID=3155551 RepID=UPI00332A2147